MLLLTATTIDAQEALRMGLVNAVFPKTDLDEAVESVTQTICKACSQNTGGCQDGVTEGCMGRGGIQ